MAQFPLVLAIEPRLLPHARQNGFNMDRKVRSSHSQLNGRTMTSFARTVPQLRVPQNV